MSRLAEPLTADESHACDDGQVAHIFTLPTESGLLILEVTTYHLTPQAPTLQVLAKVEGAPQNGT